MNFSRTPIILLAILLFAGVQTAARAERFTDRFEKTIATGANVEIRLGNTNGSVSVEVWDEDSVQLVAEKRVDASNSADAEEAFESIEIIIREGDGLLEVETKLPGAMDGFMDWILGRARNASVRYELRVPRAAELDLRTVNGHVATEGAGGRQVLHSTNGRIEVEAAEHGVEARTTNGSIRVEVSATAAEPDITLGSTNGGITLYIPDSTQARIKARTVNGRVTTELPVTIEGATSRRRLNGELNGGGAGRIEISTTNGSIKINETTRD